MSFVCTLIVLKKLSSFLLPPKGSIKILILFSSIVPQKSETLGYEQALASDDGPNMET